MVGFAKLADEEHAMGQMRRSVYAGPPLTTGPGNETTLENGGIGQVGTAVTAGGEVGVSVSAGGVEDHHHTAVQPPTVSKEVGERRGVTPTVVPMSELGGIVKDTRIEITDAPRRAA